jgi:septal ring factor EnvC (AmiA/AmiB activator)
VECDGEADHQGGEEVSHQFPSPIEKLEAERDQLRDELASLSQDDGKVERALIRSEEANERLRARVERLEKDDEVHWKTRRSLVARVERLEAMLRELWQYDGLPMTDEARAILEQKHD